MWPDHSRYSSLCKTNRGSWTNRGRWTNRKHVPFLADASHLIKRTMLICVVMMSLLTIHLYSFRPVSCSSVLFAVLCFLFIFAFLQFGFRSNNLCGPWTCTQSATVVLVTRTPTMTRQSASMAWLIAPSISTTVHAFWILRGISAWLYFDLSRFCSVRCWQPTTTSYLDYIIPQVSTLFPLLFCCYL